MQFDIDVNRYIILFEHIQLQKHNLIAGIYSMTLHNVSNTCTYSAHECSGIVLGYKW